jgi:chemotaxis protein MotA
LVQFPLSVVLTAVGRLAAIFSEPQISLESIIEQLVNYANLARRRGIASLDNELPDVQDPFMKKVLTLAVDGTEPQELRKIAELELDNELEREEQFPHVFESAGGFSPTVGIIGAVLGLIQVMQHLDKLDEVGRGIAVAFVATIYGVGAANLFLLPVAGKLRIRLREEQAQKEMVLEGVIAILGGMNPRMLGNSLRSFVGDSTSEREEISIARAAGA